MMEEEFIQLKLDYLKKQRDELHRLLDTEVDKVLHKGSDWLQGSAETQEGSSCTFKQMNNAIEHTVAFLTQKYSELSAFTVLYDGHEDTDSAAQSRDESSNSQVTQGKASSEDSSVEPKLTIKRMKKLEKTVATLTASMNSVTEESKSLKEMIDKLVTDSKETVNQWQQAGKDVESLKKDMKKMRQQVKNVESGCNYDETVESLEQRIDGLESLQPDAQKIEVLVQKVEKLEVLKKMVEDQKSSRTDHADYEVEFHELQVKVDRFCDKADKVNDLKQWIDDFENTRVKEFETGLMELQKFSTTNKEKLEQVEQATVSLSSKWQECDSNLQTLLQKTASNTSILEDVHSSQKRDCNTIAELQKQLSVKERNHRKALNSLGKKFDDVELQYKMVCQIVAGRLVPLETLREKLNGYVKYRDENIQMLNDTVKTVKALEPRVSQLETKARKPVTGFSVRPTHAVKAACGQVRNLFTDVLSNYGGCFNLNSGEFTAPVKGLYGLSLSLQQLYDGQLFAHAQRTSALVKSPVFRIYTDGDGSNSSKFTVLSLNAGDTLSVVVDNLLKHPAISSGSSFSCFFIGQ